MEYDLNYLLELSIKAACEASEEILKIYDLKPYKYFFTIARIEPENNLEMMIQGYIQSKSNLSYIDIKLCGGCCKSSSIIIILFPVQCFKQTKIELLNL